MNTLTLIHVLISLVGIASGLVMIGGWLASRQLCGWTLIYLVTTIATSVTGFLFPIKGVTPGIILGVLSLLVLAVSLFALIVKRNAGKWLIVFAVTATFALYLNFFVLIVQLFMRVPALHELAPTQGEPPFIVSQIIVLAMFLALGILAVRQLWKLPAAVPAS